MLETSKTPLMNGVSMVNEILLILERHNEVKVTLSYRKTNSCVDALTKVSTEREIYLEFGDQILDFIRQFFTSNATRFFIPRLIRCNFFFGLDPL